MRSERGRRVIQQSVHLALLPLGDTQWPNTERFQTVWNATLLLVIPARKALAGAVVAEARVAVAVEATVAA